MTTHELLTSFHGVRYLVLGDRGEAEYCTSMDAVVSAMSGMDCNGVLEFETNYCDDGTFGRNASEQAARAWLNAHRGELEFDGGDCLNAPEFIVEHAGDLLDEIAGEAICQREHDRDLERYFGSAR